MSLRNPLFTALDELLDQDGSVSVGELLDAAGEQVYGLGVLLLGTITFIPGVGSFISLGTMLLGVQMLLGQPHPWIPKRIQSYEMKRGRIKAALAKVEEHLATLRLTRAPKRAVNRRFLGFIVLWTASLAALWIPLPFANVLPALSLVLLGMALLEEWALLMWIGLLGSAATTVYFALSIRVVIHKVIDLFHWFGRLVGS